MVSYLWLFSLDVNLLRTTFATFLSVPILNFIASVDLYIAEVVFLTVDSAS